MLSLGDRMKDYYEDITRFRLSRRTPVILRLDGKAFHSWTRWCEKPFDSILAGYMQDTTRYLVDNIQGAVLGFQQSDEISILIRDYDQLTTAMWFDGNIQKIVSVAASMATGYFNRIKAKELDLAFFDARVFNIPKEEVQNYFVWRQLDIMRNSVQMMGQHHLGHKRIQRLSNSEVMEKLLEEKGISMKNVAAHYKFGYTYSSKLGWKHTDDVPFIDDPGYIEQHVYPKEDL